jgi:hypothetical protein
MKGHTVKICIYVLSFCLFSSSLSASQPRIEYFIERFYAKECSGKLEFYQEAMSKIALTAEGKIGKLIWGGAILCAGENAPAQPPWCGAGGWCRFHIVVDEKVFEGYGSAPHNVTIKGNMLIVIQVHGANCQTSNGQPGWGMASCYVTAVWNERVSSFMSIDRKIILSEKELD